jgi:(p)ppGpp synthase/HD superfamily hydrolase
MYFCRLLAVFLLFLVACEQKDPKPELKDRIYQDMIAQKDEAERIMKEMETKAADVRKSAAEAKINTGVKEKAERQAIEFEKTRDKMAQQMTYWKIRIFERLKHVRTLASKGAGPYASDTTELQTYESEKKLRQAKNAWDLKARFKETGFEYNPVLMGEEPGSKPKEKPKPAEGGGHH